MILAASVLLGCSGNNEERSGADPVPTEVATVEREGPTQPEPQASENPLVAQVGPLEFYLEDLLKLTKEDESKALPTLSGEENLKRLGDIRKETLRRMIDRRLLILGSAQYPEWVSDASWEEEVQVLSAKIGAEEFERRRNASGVTKEEFEDHFRNFVREEMMIRELIAREVETATAPTEAELQERYEKDREAVFTRPDSWAVYHIDRYLTRDRASELPKLLENLESVRAQVAEAIASATTPAGKADRMSPLVKQFSEAKDAQTGYAFIYDTPKVNFDKEFVDRVRSATLGELSPVFELAGDEEKLGGCFFLVFEHRPGDTVSFNTAKTVLAKQMVEERVRENRDRLFLRLENQFPVKIFEEAIVVGLETEEENQQTSTTE